MNFNPFRRKSIAIVMPDQSISASDAARVLSDRSKERAATRRAAERALIRATCRLHCNEAGRPIPKILEN